MKIFREFLRMRLAWRLDARGVSIMELMVSIGLMGISSLALATLVGNHAKFTARARNEALLEEQLQEFTEALETYVGNASQVNFISYGAGTSPALIAGQDISTRCTTPTCDSTVNFCVFTETANNPGQSAPAYCWNPIGSNPVGAGITPEGLILRGCLRPVLIRYVAPVSMAPGPTQPGTVTISFGSDCATPTRTIARLSGVYSFAVGVPTPDSAGNYYSSSSRVIFQIKMKAQSVNTSKSTQPGFESWYPGETGFYNGVFRQMTRTVVMKNLTTPGVHFGVPTSYRKCTANGAATADPEFCCSGYWNGASCIAATACLSAGTASAVAGQCCSRATSAGNCL